MSKFFLATPYNCLNNRSPEPKIRQRKIMDIPNLSGIADPDVVSKKGAGNFTAEYINWSRTLQDIRDNAPGWMPESVEDDNGKTCHTAPDGSKYLLIRYIHVDGAQTTCIPHAIMDNKMHPISGDMVSARDIADGFVRGACKAAAAVFGYAWQMWSKDDPMERDDEELQHNRGDDKAEPEPAVENPRTATITEELTLEQDTTSASWKEVECPLGKYQGETLGSIYSNDPQYLKWMVSNVDPKTDGFRNALAGASKALNDNGQQEFARVG